MYQTRDGRETGFWDVPDKKAWVQDRQLSGVT